MAKRYFKKKNKVKKGANLPPGKTRLKGLGRDVVPMFTIPRYTDDPDVDNHDNEANKKLANICSKLLDDPSVLARNVIIKERQRVRAGEIPECEEE